MFISVTFRSLFLSALCCLLAAFFCDGRALAEDKSVVAIDVLLKPDGVMLEQAQRANSALLKDYPEGFKLDETHNPHITLLQRYVKAENLNKVYEVAEKIVSKEKPTGWKLEAFKYYYGKMGKTGLEGIVVRPTPDLIRLQKELIEEIAPYAVPSGSNDAFVTSVKEPEVDQFTKTFVGEYVGRASGDKFNPHVTTGIGTVEYLDKLLAQPFEPFSFSPSKVCIYQLGNFGTAQKLLKDL